MEGDWLLQILFSGITVKTVEWVWMLQFSDLYKLLSIIIFLPLHSYTVFYIDIAHKIPEVVALSWQNVKARVVWIFFDGNVARQKREGKHTEQHGQMTVLGSMLCICWAAYIIHLHSYHRYDVVTIRNLPDMSFLHNMKGASLSKDHLPLFFVFWYFLSHSPAACDPVLLVWSSFLTIPHHFLQTSCLTLPCFNLVFPLVCCPPASACMPVVGVVCNRMAQ